MSYPYVRDPKAPNRVLASIAKLMGGKDRGGAQNQYYNKIRRLGMTPQQQELNRKRMFWEGVQYDNYSYGWDGDPVDTTLDREAITAGKNIPPGFKDYSGKHIPFRYRRPQAPYQIGRAVIERFTGQIFSQSVHPRLGVIGDEKTEDYLQGLAQVGRTWPTWMRARSLGGSTEYSRM
jgi:hypothetical protein